MALEPRDSAMGKPTWGITRRIGPTERESTIGLMGITIRVSFLMGLDMAKDTSKKIKQK
jgi:hypothetical protein